jgi:parvulin-like peptidyl-prolyl isomerase
MRKWFPIFFISILLLPTLSPAKVIDHVVGVVDGDVITLSELDAAMPLYGKADIPGEENPMDKEIRLREARKETLDMLVEDRLLQKVARQYNIKVEDQEVNATIEKMRQDANVDDARFKKELAARGFTLEGYQHFLKLQIIRARVIDVLIKPKISLTEDKLRAYYKNHADNYVPPEVRVSQILIQVPAEATPKDWETAKAKMEKVVQGLKNGATFEEMAALYSEDKATAHARGDMGFFTKGEMIPSLEAVVFAMGVGDVTQVMESQVGLHLFKVTDKKPGPLPAFEDIKNEVMQDYYREETAGLYAKWLEDLKARSDIEMKL